MGDVGKTLGRVATGFGTGGLSEIGRLVGGDKVNNFMDRYGDPLYMGIGGTLAGGALGGALGGVGGKIAGSALGGLAGGSLSGNAGAGAAGGGVAGLLQSLLSGGGAGGLGGGNLGQMAAGGSLLGYGLSMDPSVQRPDLGNIAGDRAAIDQQGQDLRGLYGEQNDLLGQRMQSQRDQLMQQLTTGTEGEAFRQKYNNLGLLNSGAFNQGLSNQFGNLASQQQQDILNQGISQTNSLADLSNSRLSRQFGQEDVGTQFNIAQAIQNAQLQQQKQNALIGGGSYILGGGMGGPGGGGGASGASGGGSTSIQNLLQSLMGGIGNIGTGIGNLFGGNKNPGGPTIGGGDVFGGGNLNLNPGDPYGLGAGSMSKSLFAPGEQITAQSIMANPNVFQGGQGMAYLPGGPAFGSGPGAGNFQQSDFMNPDGTPGYGYRDPNTGAWVPLQFA